MPRGKTKFQTSWLNEVDANNCIISEWCSKGKNEFEAHCSLCMCDFSIANNGKHQIIAHSSKNKHTKAYKSIKSCMKFVGTPNHSVQFQNSTSTMCVALSHEQQITKAEVYWALKVAASNYSFTSCQDLNSLFSLMFPDSELAKKIHLGEKKMSYLISYGLGPYFLSSVTQEIQQNIHNLYAVSFDETTTIQVKKQFDIYMRFWSSRNKVECAYLTSAFLGHATSEDLKKTLLDCLEQNKLPLDKLVNLSMDGPSVNKSVLKKINEELSSSRGGSKLVDIGTCSLHKVHNAMSKGLDLLNIDLDEFASDLFSFFKLSPACRETIKRIQHLLDVENHYFLRHVNSRWLTIEPVLKRIIEQYDVLSEYFLKILPKQKESKLILATPRYKRIRECLMDGSTMAYMQFTVTVASKLRPFLSLFQTEGPLIHILYTKSNELLKNILRMYIKAEIFEGKEGEELRDIHVSESENFLPIKQMDIGAGARSTLISLSHTDSKLVYLNFRTCLIRMAEYLQKELPINCTILRDLQILHPLLREKPETIKALLRLCTKIDMLHLNYEDVDKIRHEWISYQGEEISEEWYVELEVIQHGIREVTYKRIDEYWFKIFQIIDTDTGKPKYFNLSKLIKPYLLLFHGNADVERGFSLNNSLLRKERVNLSEKSIISIRTVKDVIRRHGNCITNIPITSTLLKKVKEARSAYVADLERQKSEAEVEKRNKKQKEKEDEEKKMISQKRQRIEEEIKNLEKKRRKIENEVQTGQKLLEEGSERLNKALEKKDIKSANLASGIITAGREKIEHNMKNLSETNKTKNMLDAQLALLK